MQRPSRVREPLRCPQQLCCPVRTPRPGSLSCPSLTVGLALQPWKSSAGSAKSPLTLEGINFDFKIRLWT